MYDDPALRLPVMSAVVAAGLLVAVWKIEWDPRVDWLRYFFLIIGVIMLFLSAATGLDYLFARFSQRVWAIQNALYAPKLQLVRLAAQLNDKQLQFVKDAGAVNGVIQVMPAGIEWHFETPWGRLDADWVYNYLQGAFVNYPNMPLIRGDSEGSINREQNRIITDWMIAWGLAEPARGNKPAQWLATKEVVLKTLQLWE